MTLDALKAAVAVLPAAKPRLCTLSLVMMAVITVPLPSVRMTSELTAPLTTSVTVPVSWLLVDRRMPAVSVSRMTDDALISAKASEPAFRPSDSVLLWVRIATIAWPSGSVMATSSFTAPRWMAETLPLNWLRALVNMVTPCGWFRGVMLSDSHRRCQVERIHLIYRVLYNCSAMTWQRQPGRGGA